MAAIVTDQFRILNSKNFLDSVRDPSNSYYIFLSLPNPSQVGFGRTSTWDSSIPTPQDNFNYLDHVKDTILFGKRITSDNIRRLIRKVQWQKNTIYETISILPFCIGLAICLHYQNIFLFAFLLLFKEFIMLYVRINSIKDFLNVNWLGIDSHVALS